MENQLSIDATQPRSRRNSTFLVPECAANFDSDGIPIRASGTNVPQLAVGGFLDVALFMADVEHFKFLLDMGSEHVNYFWLLAITLVLSLFLQIVVFVLLFVIGFRKRKSENIPYNEIRNHITYAYENDPSRQRESSITNPITDQNQLKTEYNLVIDSNLSLLDYIVVGLGTMIAILNVITTVFGNRTASDVKKYHEKMMAIANFTQFN